MGRVAVAVAAARKQAELEDTPRPYRNHYAGQRTGACSTAENAAEAAFSHVLRGHCTNAQVVSPNGKDLFRMHWTSMGMSVWSPIGSSAYKRLPGVEWEQAGELKRIK